MSERTDLYGYLGDLGMSPFIRAGHNKYRKPEVTGVSDGKATVYGKNKLSQARWSKDIDKLKASTARRAIKAGGDVGLAVASERPVLSAKMGKYESKKDRAAAIKAARSDPNSARSERKEARAEKKAKEKSYRGEVREWRKARPKRG